VDRKDRAPTDARRSAQRKMNAKSKIIKFPSNRSRVKNSHGGDVYLDFEEWESYQEYIVNEDYAGLVRYCERRAEKHPNDLYAQYHLGNAYVLNGKYKKAIEFMASHHKKHPWNSDYQYVILESLFALGKTENDFQWIEKPKILRMSPVIVNACYEYLKRKRKPRSIMELYTQFVTEGYLLFSDKDLLNELLNDERFKIDNPDDEFWAEVSVVRKKRK
jgi:tetratricopeptide (TPR) repeat protein